MIKCKSESQLMFFLAYLLFIYLSFWCLETSSLAGEFRSKFPDPVSTGSVLDLQQQAYLRLALTVCKDYNANDEFIELVFRADYRWQNITYKHLINARVWKTFIHSW